MLEKLFLKFITLQICTPGGACVDTSFSLYRLNVIYNYADQVGVYVLGVVKCLVG